MNKQKIAKSSDTKLYKTGFVAIIARPNAGKSTLLNKITGQKIAITTPVAQTTRKRIKGIYTDDNAQIVFIDTPGIHKPLNKLGEFLTEQALEALSEADLILFITDISSPAGKGDVWIVENCIKKANKPVIIAANKIDTVSDENKRELNAISYKTLFEENYPLIRISAKTGKNVDVLLETLKSMLLIGAPMYPSDEITDQNVRTIASEIIREKIILNSKDEIPHSVAVLIDEYKSENAIDRIKATIYVSSESQKGIIIGKNGRMLKKIGVESRLEIEDMIEKKVFLELFVKVKKNWQKDKNALKMFGYTK